MSRGDVADRCGLFTTFSLREVNILSFGNISLAHTPSCDVPISAGADGLFIMTAK